MQTNNLLVGGHEYKYSRKLGKGSFGMVVETENIITLGGSIFVGPKMAMKFTLIKKEEEVLKKLKDPHYELMYKELAHISRIPLLKFYNAGRVEVEGHEWTYILMPIYEKVNGTFSVYNMCSDILKGINYIHWRGIRHGDIYMPNIMYDSRKKNYVLCDFGLARDIGEKFKLKNSLWNNYRSRDCLKGESTRRCDYEMLTYTVMNWEGKSLPWNKVPGGKYRLKHKLWTNERYFMTVVKKYKYAHLISLLYFWVKSGKFGSGLSLAKLITSTKFQEGDGAMEEKCIKETKNMIKHFRQRDLLFRVKN